MSPSNRAPVAEAIFPANASPSEVVAAPFSKRALRLLDFSAFATFIIVSDEGSGGINFGKGAAAFDASFHAVSAGSMSVAI